MTSASAEVLTGLFSLAFVAMITPGPNQFPAAALAAFAEILRIASRRRAIFHVASEGERMTLARIVDGRSDVLISVVRSAHGRWIQWSDG